MLTVAQEVAESNTGCACVARSLLDELVRQMLAAALTAVA